MSDVVPAALMLALSAAIFFETRNLGYWAETTPGPAFLPVWLVASAIVLVVLRLAEAWRAGRGSGVEWPDRPAVVRVSLIFAGLLAIPLLAPTLGLVPSLILFMVFLLLVVLRRPLLPSLATIAITSALVYGIFVLWLRVPLPTGILKI